MTSKQKKKVPDDILQLLDVASLAKFTHAADLQTTYTVPVVKLPSYVSLPAGFEMYADYFPLPNIFGKQPVYSLRCAFPPGTHFANGQDAPFITAKQATASQPVDLFQEHDLLAKLTSDFAMSLLRNGALSVSKNQFQVSLLLRFFSEKLPSFSLNPVFAQNTAATLDKTQNLWLQLVLDGYKVAVYAGNSVDGHFLRQKQCVRTAEGDFELENYYAMALNSVVDTLGADLHRLVFGTLVQSGAINQYWLPYYNIQREIAAPAAEKLVYCQSNTFYTEFAKRFEATFGKQIDISALDQTPVLLPVMEITECAGKRFAKILSTDPIVSVLMADELTADQQDVLRCYTEERRLKMHRFIYKRLGGDVPGIRHVYIADYVKPPTPKLSITEQYARRVESDNDAPQLPRLRKFKSEAYQQQLMAQKSAELAAAKEQYEPVWLDKGDDADLYEDDEETSGMDFFYIALENLAKITDCLKIYEIGDNTANLLRINGQRAIQLNLSVSALASAQEKGTQRFTTQTQGCANMHTFCIKSEECDPGSVLSFDFEFLEGGPCDFARMEIIQDGKHEVICARDRVMLYSCDWCNGAFLIVKFEFLVAPEGMDFVNAVEKGVAYLSRCGCIVHVSGRSYSVSNISIEPFHGKNCIVEAAYGNNNCRSCASKTVPVLSGLSMAHAVFYVTSERLERDYYSERDSSAGYTDNELLTANRAPGTVTVDGVEYPIDVLNEDEMDVSADSANELYGKPSRTPSKRYRFRRAAHIPESDSFTLWVYYDDGMLCNAEYTITIQSSANDVFVHDVPYFANGKPELQSIEVPFSFAQRCYDQAAGAYKFFVILKARQNSAPVADAKGKQYVAGIFPYSIRLFCYAPVRFALSDARLAVEANEAAISLPGAYTLQLQAASSVLLSFDTCYLQSEMNAQAKPKAVSSKPSSVALLSRQQSSAQVQGQDHATNTLLALCQIVQLPQDARDALTERQEKPQSSNKLREPQSHNDQLDILRQNAATLKRSSEDLPVLHEFQCLDKHFAIIQAPQNMQITFVFHRVEREQMRLLVQSLGDETLPQLTQISIPNIVLNRITQTLFSKEFAAAADAFKKSCQHLNIAAVPSDIAKLQYATNIKGIVDIVPDKGKKAKTEIVTNPELMSQNILSQQKQISIDIKDDEPMFGVAATKAKAPAKSKAEAGGFIDEICSELKDGVQRTYVECLFKISIQ